MQHATSNKQHASNMTTDQLEFLISQYLDGTLAAEGQAALEERLATDAEARELFAEYQQLDSVVKSALPLPDIAWDDFARSVSQATADETPPVRSYRMRIAWVGSAVALAASVAIAFGIVFANRGHEPGKPSVEIAQVPTSRPQGSITVTGPTIETAAQPAVAQVTISAPTAMAQANQWRYASDIVTRPSRVIIASSAESGQDSSSMPY